MVSDVGGGPAPDASALVKRFKDEEFPKIMVSVNMLDTGLDCPEVVSLVMARFTRSAILYMYEAACGAGQGFPIVSISKSNWRRQARVPT